MSKLSNAVKLLAFDNRWQLLTERILFRNTNIQVHRINSVEMIVDHRAGDAGSIRDCIAGSMYKDFIKSLSIDYPITVADFGANVGGFSCLLKVMNLRISDLLCVEMNPRTYERLRFNVMSNFDINPKVINAALCSASRSIDLELALGSTGDNIYEGSRGKQPADIYSIQGRTFDELCKTYLGAKVIDICKIDIEGAEAEVFSPYSDSISSIARCRYLIIEMHPAEHYDSMLNVLNSHGFHLLKNDGKSRCGVHLFKNEMLHNVHHN